MSKPSTFTESDLENGSIPSYEEAVPPPPYIPKPSAPTPAKLQDANRGTNAETITQYWIDPSQWRIFSTQHLTPVQLKRRYWINMVVTMLSLLVLTGIIFAIAYTTQTDADQNSGVMGIGATADHID